ncbi:MAG: hypothetical protein NUW06_02305 [Candidatus Acetothermia bacterium]|jgi:hypothetical protein|nr:hypothetical protein [Candidatus Acetothermia bacterium]MDH7504601.1 hypothetical protein [Candidatus Acetothermia bacterium]
MRILVSSALLLGLWFLLSGGLWGGALGTGNFYKATISLPQPDISTIAARAQGLGFWIRLQQGLEVMYLHGTELCSFCAPAGEESFFGFPQLYLDGELFLVRLDEDCYRLGIRPSPELRGAYEVIVRPKVNLDLTVIEQEAAGWLQQLGIVQTPSLQFVELAPPEKPQPPAGARLESVLYALAIAADWHDFARERGISLFGLRIKVIVELVNPEVTPQGYHLLEEARAGELMRVQVPVSELVRLSTDPAVRFVRLPYEPHEAGGG